MPEHLQPLTYAIAGYLVLQVLLNVVLSFILRKSGAKPVHALLATFWSSIVNAAYFLLVATVLIRSGLLSGLGPPKFSLLLRILLGLPSGFALWIGVTLARKLGLETFGRSGVIAAEDAIMAVPPSPAYLGLGFANISLVQPLAKELFLRAVYFPVLAANTSLPAAILAAMAIEFLLKLSVTWIFMTGFYSLAMCGLYYWTGSAVSGIVAACLAGLLHGLALARVAAKQRNASVKLPL